MITFISSSNQGKISMEPLTSEVDKLPLSTSEKIVREDMQKLDESSKQIRKLKEQLSKSNTEKDSSTSTN